MLGYHGVRVVAKYYCTRPYRMCCCCCAASARKKNLFKATVRESGVWNQPASRREHVISQELKEAHSRCPEFHPDKLSNLSSISSNLCHKSSPSVPAENQYCTLFLTVVVWGTRSWRCPRCHLVIGFRYGTVVQNVHSTVQ